MHVRVRVYCLSERFDVQNSCLVISIAFEYGDVQVVHAGVGHLCCVLDAFIKRSQMMGYVPVHDDSASDSTLPMNKFAKVGATGVPMATPFSCLKCLSPKPDVFSFRMSVSISLSMFFILFSLEPGGCVGMACWSAMFIPSTCGING